MTDDLQNKVKIRFKFRSGEEFEAEGNPDFIEKQRADFLQLIGKDGSRARRNSPATLETNVQTPAQEIIPEREEGYTEQIRFIPVPPPISPAANTEEPAFYRRKTEGISPNSPVRPTTAPVPPQIHPEIPAADRREQGRFHPRISAPVNSTQIPLWEQIIRTDDKLVFLRRKSRQLSSDTAALVLLAAAKVLLGASDGYSALLLSKALKKSGYGGERLDRVLAGEMRQGTIRSDGTKRSRLYLLSDEGFARAYVLATKLADEWHI